MKYIISEQKQSFEEFLANVPEEEVSEEELADLRKKEKGKLFQKKNLIEDMASKIHHLAVKLF